MLACLTFPNEYCQKTTCWIKSGWFGRKNTENNVRIYVIVFTPKLLNDEQKEKYAEMARQWKATKSEVVAEKVTRRMKYLKPVNTIIFKRNWV